MRDPQELLDLVPDLQAAHASYLEWANVCDRFDRGRNSILGQIMIGLEGGTELRKMLAYADPKYVKYLRDWELAEQNRVKAQVAFETKEHEFQALRSYFAYLRDSLQKLGG